MIKKLKLLFKGLYDCIVWGRQYKVLVSGPRKTNFIYNSEWYRGCKILMMVPHADDELISSFTVLCDADNITIYYCGFTGSNNMDDNRAIRRNEISNLCAELNIPLIEGKGGCDNLENVIKQGNYDTILLPSLVDWHQEHRKINYITYDVCCHLNITPQIYCYSVTIPNESEEKILSIPLSKEKQEKKYDMFSRIYISQKFMPIKRFIINERINGYHANSFASETFLMYDFEKWTKMVTKLKKLELIKDSELFYYSSNLKNNLNNLELVRLSSREFYVWLEQ